MNIDHKIEQCIRFRTSVACIEWIRTMAEQAPGSVAMVCGSSYVSELPLQPNSLHSLYNGVYIYDF